MTPDEASRVLRVLSAAFPREEWPEDTKRLWTLELEPYSVHQGLAAARELARTSEFLNIAAFHKALASVREHVADRHHEHADYDRPALEAGVEPEPDPEVRARYLAEIREGLLKQKAKSHTALTADAPDKAPGDPLRARIPRPDENYFKAKGYIE